MRFFRELIPQQTRSDVDAARVEHSDLAQLSRDQVWAEHLLLRQHLAELFWHRRAQTVIGQSPDGSLITSAEWARDRVQRLGAELQRRDQVKE